MEEEEKAKFAEKLASRAELGLKAIKILFIAVCVTVAAFVAFAVVSASVGLEDQGRLIGYIILIAAVAAEMCAVVGVFVFTKLNLDKLKKLK